MPRREGIVSIDAVHLYDRRSVDAAGDDLSLTRRLLAARGWAAEREIAVCTEYLAVPVDGMGDVPADTLTRALTACAVHRHGLLVWDPAVLGDASVQLWCARNLRLRDLPLLCGEDDRLLAVAGSELRAVPTAFPVAAHD